MINAMNNEKCAMQRISGNVLCSILSSVIRSVGQMYDKIFWEYQYSIYQLVQNIFPAEMNFQMQSYQEYSNK